MTLSIIIVNYNVKYFIEQAIRTSLKASEHIDAEIIVVDNASIDGSQSMIKNFFPEVQLIDIKNNLGFSKANNIGIAAAKGEFILLLNPDTVVGENTFVECLKFIQTHSDCGALTVKMLDGSGKLLPESKRGFPTPWAAFCKFSGLYKIFPKSKFFNQYYLGHLSYDEIQKIDVMPGAFILVRKNIVDQIGGLDESYFMYGEDIDFSYQVKKHGYENYYLPEPHIIHYKGESTSKSSINYIKSFYNAMIIFTNKYYSGLQKFGLLLILKLAIIFQASLSFVKHNLIQIIRPLLDILIIFFGIKYIASLWSIFYHHQENYFSEDSLNKNAILYSILWIAVALFHGFYDRIIKIKDILIILVIGLILNLSIYSVLPESYRSSRVILLLSSVFVAVYLFAVRFIILFFQSKNKRNSLDKSLNYLIIGDEHDEDFVKSIFDHNQLKYSIVKRLDPSEKFSETQIREMVKILSVDEIIFSSDKFQTLGVLDYISKLGALVSYKIISKNTQSLISSASKNTKGELIHFSIAYKLTDRVYRRQKRIFDVMYAIFLFLFFPIIIFFQRNISAYFLNIWQVLIGHKTWVGYTRQAQEKYDLPHIKPALFSIYSDQEALPNEILEKYILTHYAQNYSIFTDIHCCLQNITNSDIH
ncbi:MAG TPA: glycosyltransferase family 2 protein [Saprospiraceae bacterium]|nr:glycosyltransferase family 2 protein [Saprospiraceae bacterium]